ncbi:MAG: hypothetical protein MR210_02000 [Erysipelotrichaceae bacterium]|nr:hypothetical protein [Erysipelotrichaceae bacterium]MDY5252255.1 hypothetical protein [Erysipelotrichaceae bacterium]
MKNKIDLFEKENNEILALLIICHIYGIDFNAAYNRDRPDLQIRYGDLSLGIEVTLAADKKYISAIKMLEQGKLIKDHDALINDEKIVIDTIKHKMSKQRKYAQEFADRGLFIYCFFLEISCFLLEQIKQIQDLEQAFDHLYLYNFTDILIIDCHDMQVVIQHFNFFTIKKLLKQLQSFDKEKDLNHENVD